LSFKLFDKLPSVVFSRRLTAGINVEDSADDWANVNWNVRLVIRAQSACRELKPVALYHESENVRHLPSKIRSTAKHQLYIATFCVFHDVKNFL
jgi:hypothetical protein